MEIITQINKLPDHLKGGAVLIGNFDGVHRGHVRLIESLREMAQLVGGSAIVFTMSPHPVEVLRPEGTAPPVLTLLERKLELFASLGVDATIVYPTNQAFLHIEPVDFFETIVREKLDARAMVEGTNFYFGRARAGNVEMLDRLCREADIRFLLVQPVLDDDDGEMISSSRIRHLISAGNVEKAAELLGRPHQIEGLVLEGERRGRTLGFPTANLDMVQALIPGNGIYAARATVEGQTYPAAVCIGENVTFGGQQLKIEAHLLDFDADIYNHHLKLDFHARLRDLVRYDSPDQLTASIRQDVAAVREIFE
ncbi:MAG: bifunctional riboflavin kinase/FAD synthetase [Planctomycetia bacterium]